MDHICHWTQGPVINGELLNWLCHSIFCCAHMECVSDTVYICVQLSDKLRAGLWAGAANT